MAIILPEELVDHILSYLHNDAHSLLSLSLVCRSFTPTSRKHMVGPNKVWRLTGDDLNPLLCVLDHPYATLGYYIRSLSATLEGRSEVYYWTKLAELLPRVQSLHITGWRMEIGANWGDCAKPLDLMKAFDNVTEVAFENCQLEELELFEMLNAFSKLAVGALSFQYVAIIHRGFDPQSVLEFDEGCLSGLHTLRLLYVREDNPLNGLPLLATKSAGNLRNLALYAGSAGAEGVHRTLKAAASVLEILNLDLFKLGGYFSPIRASKFTLETSR